MANLANLEALAKHEAEPRGPVVSPWPELAPEAMHGLAGDYVRMIEPHTESDPVAVLVQFLVLFGNVIGRTAHFRVEAHHHYLNLFAVAVGASSKARKGTSKGQALRLFEKVDSEWVEQRFESGFTSGEGLIWAVRDPIVGRQRTKGGTYETVEIDPGVDDKRLVVTDEEFSSTLQVLARSGNTLSGNLRKAWDGVRLSALSKNSPARATGAHVSVVAHITQDELLRLLSTTEAGNGFGNRFLWFICQRSKYLSEGGRSHELDFEPLAERLRQAVTFARSVGEISRDEPTRVAWDRVYREISEGKPGLLGSMIARAEAQAARLSCIYALLDGSATVREPHLQAALALWDYCEASVRCIFGDALGDPDADEILRALRHSPEGMTRTEIRDLFQRNRRSAAVERSLGRLLGQGLVEFEKEPTNGRPAERWVAKGWHR